MLGFLLPSLIFIACNEQNKGTEIDINEEHEFSAEPAVESEDPLDIDDDGDGFSENEGDCDDSDGQVHPDAVEFCDGVDTNCNDVADDNPNDGIDHYLDVDGDGFGSGSSQGLICEIPDGYSDNNLDCNDGFAEINPNGTEICGDELDNDCNGQIDEGSIWFEDSDQDGFGDPSSSIEQCGQPNGYVEDNTDCDSENGSIFPNAPEIPNDNLDQDCDGSDLITTTSLTYSGTEHYFYDDAAADPSTFECDMLWNASGTSSSVPCTNCDYVFDIIMTYDTSSVVSLNCTNFVTDFNYTYGFVADYDGAGNPALLMYYSTDGWEPWIIHGSSSLNLTDVVFFTGSSFSYSKGYQDYLYQGSYHSNFWLGIGSAQ